MNFESKITDTVARAGVSTISCFVLTWTAVYATSSICSEKISLLWNYRILNYTALKINLDKLRRMALDSENQSISSIKELANETNLSAENKLSDGLLYIALKDTLKVYSQNMEIKMNYKTAKILENSKLWNSFLA